MNIIDLECLVKEIKVNEDTELHQMNGIPIIYIFDIGMCMQHETMERIFKIGITKNICKIINFFKKIAPFGNFVLLYDIQKLYSTELEEWIHLLMKPHLNGDSTYTMTLDKASFLINTQINMLVISKIHDNNLRRLLLSKLSNEQDAYLNNMLRKKTTCEYATQTELNTSSTINNVQIKKHNKFNEFISQYCDVGETYEVSSKDIIGQYRIWAKSVDKETYHNLLEYLTTYFRPVRLQLQIKEQVVNGFRGIKLKPKTIQISVSPSNPETFIFHICKFTPSGKILQKDIFNEYKEWSERVGQDIDINDLKLYLQDNDNVLLANIWTASGNGLGYYGLCLKTNDIHYRRTSSTAKKVQKRDLNDVIIDSWSTIAKAAQSEGLSSAKLSRMIKNNVKLETCYYTAT